jgi:hypothetical protein
VRMSCVRLTDGLSAQGTRRRSRATQALQVEEAIAL